MVYTMNDTKGKVTFPFLTLRIAPFLTKYVQTDKLNWIVLGQNCKVVGG